MAGVGFGNQAVGLDAFDFLQEGRYLLSVGGIIPGLGQYPAGPLFGQGDAIAVSVILEFNTLT